MAKKSWSTISRITPLTGKGTRKRIRVPQPEDKAYTLRKRDVARWEEINLESDRFTLHKRGPRRTKVGKDQLEQRAISKYQLKGTLPERIVYKYLVDYLRFVPGIDFDFQSSMDGGRLELGGIVADFLFEYLKIVIQVQGPTHNTILRKAKDEEQTGDLMLKGFRVIEIPDEIIYDEYIFEETMRRLFALPGNRGGGGGSHGSLEGLEAQIDYSKHLDLVEELMVLVIDYYGRY